MRLLFLTSGKGVQGVVSDDGFVIGQVTMDTLNLLITGALFGVVGAFVYLGVRPYMIGPRWVRVLTCGVAAGAVLGSVVVNPTGVDVTRLDPVSLAVALFVAIPALFAVLTALAIEYVLAPGGWSRAAPLPIVAAPLVIFLFPPLFIVVGIPALLVVLVRRGAARWSELGTLIGHRGVFWLARLSWAAVAAIGVVALAKDVIALA
ncbi:MAG: hypothetical protein O3B31_03385 [Chloroflexi bacterium]|nr:hypothetical protein [Chloroflexota bacterium]MDA1002382.1 hypothetical protein [Chloroflexota bacterium]